MIRNMRHKFVWITMLSLGVILCLNLMVIYQAMTVSNRSAAEAVLRGVIQEDGRIDFKNPPMLGDGEMAGDGSQSGKDDKKSQETLAVQNNGDEQSGTDVQESQNGRSLQWRNRRPEQMTRLANLKQTFAVRIDQDNQVLEVIDNGRSSFEEEEICAMVETILASGSVSGMIQNHRYLTGEKPYGKIIAFLDCSHERDNLSRLLIICLVAGVSCIVVLLGVVIWLSYWAVKPVEEGFRRQKQFVADASHELKTPLTVISANTSVLENLHGRSQWTENIQTDISRMNHLINDMLRLARLEQSESELKHISFDFSQMVSGLLLSFESMAFETEKIFSYEVEPDIHYIGNQEELRRMLSVFLENAFKYSEAGGRITCFMKKEHANREKSKIIVEIYNTGSGISEEARAHIFERFYREENSHSREKEGFGLGLSIAGQILERHKGRVRVESDGGSYTLFRLIL